MASKIYIDVIVDDKGTTKKMAVDAKTLESALNKTGREAQKTDRNIKGVAGASANGTKNFAKMAQGIGGTLVPAYASLAATIFAVTAGFNALKNAAQLDQLEAGLEYLGNRAGTDLKALSDELKNITGNAISAADAMRSVAVGTGAGFSPDDLRELTVVAEGASKVLGRDLADSLDRVIRGTAKLEPEILDELGIIAKIGPATEKYAASLGKTANELTEFERQQAFLNEVITQGTAKYGQAAEAIPDNEFNQLASSMKELTKETLTLIAKAIGPLVNLLSVSPEALLGILTLMSTTITSQIAPSIADMAKDASEGAQEMARAFSEDLFGAFESLEVGTDSLSKNLEKTIPNAKKAAENYSKVVDLTTDENERIKLIDSSIRSLNSSRAKYQGETKKDYNARIKLIDKEIDKYKELRIAATTIRDAEGTEQVARTAKNRAKLYNAEAIALEKLGKPAVGYRQKLDNIKEAFGGLAEANRNYVKAEIASAKAVEGSSAVHQRYNIILSATRARMVAVANTAKLMGAALLRAIPIIGQAVFIFGLLKTAFDFFNKDSELDENLKKTEKVIESFKKQYAQLNDELFRSIDGETELEKRLRSIASTYSVVAGQIDSLNSSLRSMIELEKRTILVSAVGKKATLSDLDDLRAGRSGALRRETIETEFLSSDSIEKLKEGINKALGSELVTGDIAKGSSVLQAYAKQLRDVKSILDEGGQVKPEMLNLLFEIGDQARAAEAAITGVGSASMEFTKQLNKLSGKSNTKYSDTVNSLSAFGNNLSTLLGGNGKGLVDLKAATAAMESFQEATGVLTNITDVNEYSSKIKQIVEAEKAILDSKANQKVLQSELVVLQNKSTGSVTDIKNIALKEREINTQKIKDLESLLSLQDKLGLSESQMLATSKEIAALRSGQKRNAQINAESLEASLKIYSSIKREVLEISEAQKDGYDRIIKAEEGLLRNQELLKNLRGGFDPAGFQDKLSPEQELRLFKDFQKDKEEAIKEELKLKKQLLDLELTLKEAELRSLAANTNDESLSNKLISAANNIDELKRNAGIALYQEKELALSALELEGEKLAKAAKEMKVVAQLTDSALSGIQSGFANTIDGMFTGAINGTKDLKNAFADMTISILEDMSKILAKQLAMQAAGALFGGLFGSGAPSADNLGTAPGTANGVPPTINLNQRYGGIVSNGKELPGYATGGIASGPQAGYPVMMHGTEAVVPLGQGREIPVELKGGSSEMNNVNITVQMGGSGNANETTDSEDRAGKLGKAISLAVQEELKRQKRPGGILSRYGAA